MWNTLYFFFFGVQTRVWWTQVFVCDFLAKRQMDTVCPGLKKFGEKKLRKIGKICGNNIDKSIQECYNNCKNDDGCGEASPCGHRIPLRRGEFIPWMGEACRGKITVQKDL